MKTTLLLAGAFALLLAGGAAARDTAKGVHADKTKTVRAVRKPTTLKDPYANYWNDPSRQGFPSWGLRDVR